MTRYRWASWGDLNAFFGLMLDNVAVMIFLLGTIATGAAGPDHYAPEFVLGRMIPGTAIGVLLGDLVYTWFAFRLARQTGRTDVTAMPLGLDTPSTFAVGLLVLLPALREWLADHPGDTSTAMVYGWHVGAAVLVLIGICKTLLAPAGNLVRRWVPQAGLLGSLAAIALALIAFLPLVMDIATVPLVGFLALTVILVTLVAHRPLPGRIPGALAAVLIGVGGWFLMKEMGKGIGWPLVPGGQGETITATGPLAPLPPLVWELGWWQRVLLAALGKLPVALPFALATVIGGIDCTESAASAGDEYDTGAILLTEGLASVAAGLLGGVIQNTPYIGHPAYKAMGGRAAYTLATALFVGLAGCLGWFTVLFEWLPRPAMYPILVFVGLEITAQSFRATPQRHYAAVAVAMLPALAAMAIIPVNRILGPQPPPADAALMVQTLRCLANGFIVTSLLWAAALADLIDGRLGRAGVYLMIAALCAFFGVIHSPLPDAPIGLPHHVLARLPAGDVFRCQSPYHWSAAYCLAATLLFALVAVRPYPGFVPGELENRHTHQ